MVQKIVPTPMLLYFLMLTNVLVRLKPFHPIQNANGLLQHSVSQSFSASAPFSDKQISIAPLPGRAEVWWCLGRLLDCMPPEQMLVLSSGVWWSLLLDIHCLWRHSTTSYSCLQTNVLATFA